MKFIKRMYFSISPFKTMERFVDFVMMKNGLIFRSVQLDNYTVNYWDSETDKPAIIMLPAFAAESKYTWYKQTNKLKHQFRIIIPNLIYFGGSIANKNEYTISEQVSALEELIKFLNLKSISICGASYGGIIAFEYASKNIAKIEKIVIVNSPIKYSTEESSLPIYKRFEVKGKAELLIPDNHIMLKKLFNFSYYNPPLLPTIFFKSIYKNLYKNNIENQRRVIRKFEEERDLMKEKEYYFSFPILLIWGKEDVLTPIEIGEKLQNYFGDNVNLVIIPKTSHVPHLEKPKAFNKLLASFLYA